MGTRPDLIPPARLSSLFQQSSLQTSSVTHRPIGIETCRHNEEAVRSNERDSFEFLLNFHDHLRGLSISTHRSSFTSHLTVFTRTYSVVNMLGNNLNLLKCLFNELSPNMSCAQAPGEVPENQGDRPQCSSASVSREFCIGES